MHSQTTRHNVLLSAGKSVRHDASHTAGLGPRDDGEKSTSKQPARYRNLPSSDVASLSDFSDGDITDGPSLRMPPQVPSLDTGINLPPSKNSIDVLCDLPACGIAFNSSNVQQHLRQYHANLERKHDKIICPTDGHMVTDANYGRHILDVHFKYLKGWCDTCKKEFSRKDNLKRHMKTHKRRE